MMSELVQTGRGKPQSLRTTSLWRPATVVQTLPHEIVLWDVDSTIAEDDTPCGNPSRLAHARVGGPYGPS